MGYTQKTLRPTWQDRFRRPTLEDLRAGLDRQLGSLLDETRSRLLTVADATEEVAWQGVPWRWTLVYRRRTDKSARAWAYLVPEPSRPKLALPITHAQIDAVRLARLKKHAKDGIGAAKQVGDVLWATWELSSRTQLDELMELVDRLYGIARARRTG